MSNTTELIHIFKNYFISKPINKAWLFGSYARNEQTPDSDIDILVDFDKDSNLNLFSLAAIIIDLEKLSGKKIDLIDAKRVLPGLTDFIDKDKILIYERN